MTKIKKIIRLSIFLLIGLAAIAAITFFYLAQTLPSLNEIKNRQVPESTKIYDRTGKILLYEVSRGEKRTYIPLADIPESLKNSTLAIEDARFYEEPSFSVRGILRALLANLSHGRIVQGGSTITQQLAKNAFLSSEQTLARKAKEFILAIQIDRHYSKNQILESYLNEIPYGPTLYGVEAASLAYFGKSAKDLSLAESAILAAIPKAPSYYSPWGTHQKELQERQKLVLRRMLELNKINKQKYEAALNEKIIFAPQDTKGIKAPHFVIFVQDYLVQKYGEDLVQSGGLKVITTLDWPLQEIAEKTVSEGAERNEELYQGKNAALVAQDPKTGQILAMVGSRDYFDAKNEGNFNVATQGLRQPGSALKPFVYLAAMQAGYTPDTVLFDVPTEFDTSGQPEKSYHPENFDGRFRGPISIRQALAQSVNIPAVKTLYLVGLPKTLELVKNFGITTLDDPRRYGLSLVLGGGEVKLVDMIEAYAVLAEDGIKHNQSFILEIRDRSGNIIESFNDSSETVADPQPVRLINDILSDTEARAGLYTSSLALTLVSGHDIALKTGTSNDYRDAWVFGYTPSLITGIWAGNNDNSPMQRRGSSILAALPIWHAFMSEALKDRAPEAFTRPEPTPAQKPILAGNYLASNQVHTILYYVDKDNPTGPYPTHPESDPQFQNWEGGVLAWARNNLSNFSNLNSSPGIIPLSLDQNQPVSPFIEINIKKPNVGEFVNGNTLSFQASVKSPSKISEIAVYLNKSLIQKSTQNFGTAYELNWQLTPSALNPQNILEIKVSTEDRKQSQSSVIFYH